VCCNVTAYHLFRRAQEPCTNVHASVGVSIGTLHMRMQREWQGVMQRETTSNVLHDWLSTHSFLPHIPTRTHLPSHTTHPSLRHTANRGNTLQHTSTDYLTLLQCVAVCCSVLKCVVLCSETVRHEYNTRCFTLQHTATQCNTLQHTATHCNTLRKLCRDE